MELLDFYLSEASTKLRNLESRDLSLILPILLSASYCLKLIWEIFSNRINEIFTTPTGHSDLNSGGTTPIQKAAAFIRKEYFRLRRGGFGWGIIKYLLIALMLLVLINFASTILRMLNVHFTYTQQFTIVLVLLMSTFIACFVTEHKRRIRNSAPKSLTVLELLNVSKEAFLVLFIIATWPILLGVIRNTLL